MASRTAPGPLNSRRRCTDRAGGTSLYHFAAILPRTGPVRGRSRPEDLIPPPAPLRGGCGSPSLGRCALVAALPRLRLPAPGGEGPPAEDAPASLPAQEPSWPASCLSSTRASCPRLVAGPGSRTSPHGSRALRRPARRPPGSASSTSRACAVQHRSLALVAAQGSWVAFCPLRASRLRGRGFASYAATPPPSGTPLPPWVPHPRCPLQSLHAPPPLLRCGALRWPAPCGLSHPWQDGQGSLPARGLAPGILHGKGHIPAIAVSKGGASPTGLILVAAFQGQSVPHSHGASGASAGHPWQAFAAPALALSLPDRHGRLRSAQLAGKPRWRFAHGLGWRGCTLHPFWL